MHALTEREREHSSRSYLLPGTANGLLPARVMPCSDWLEEEELEDRASPSGWYRWSSRWGGLLHTIVWGDEVGPFFLGGGQHVGNICYVTLT